MSSRSLMGEGVGGNQPVGYGGLRLGGLAFGVFSVLRPWPKRVFYRFLSFGRGRKLIFRVFYPSAVAETQFSLFFTFRPWPKLSFRCFLSFGRGRNSVFAVFCLSAVAET